MKRVLLEAIVEAFHGVTAPRFFRSERGYQGRFYCAPQEALDRRGVLKDGLILEMEYQKAARHGMTSVPTSFFMSRLKRVERRSTRTT